VRSAFRLSAGEHDKDVAQKLEMGLSALGLQSNRNLGLLLHLLGLKRLTTHWPDSMEC
jgi:hypothetical protein